MKDGSNTTTIIITVLITAAMFVIGGLIAYSKFGVTVSLDNRTNEEKLSDRKKARELEATEVVTLKDGEKELTWMRCSVGQQWNGKNCTGRAIHTDFTFYDKIEKYNQKYVWGGFDNWRMPTFSELTSIVKNENIPTIDKNTFPNTEEYCYWSQDALFTGYSSPKYEYKTSFINFFEGRKKEPSDWGEKRNSQTCALRLVRDSTK
jgi:hypothetical protein